MPIICRFDALEQNSLILAVQHLLEKEIIHLPPTREGKVNISMILHIQQIRAYKARRIKALRPKGIRVLLTEGRAVVAAVDFYYKKGKCEFAHVILGDFLNDFIAALNQIEAFYHDRIQRREIAVIDLFMSQQSYIISYTEARSQLFTFLDNHLKRLTKSQFSNRLKQFSPG